MTQQPDYRKVSLEDFIEQSAAATPTPGGGSIAATAGALGAAMLAMAVNFTRGKPKFAAVAAEMDAAAIELTRARAMFLELMNEDMAAFSQWQAAWRMDKSDPARAEALKVASAAAVAVPQEMAALAVTLLAKVDELAEKVNPQLLSDAVVAAVMLKAAVHAAHVNIRVNIPSLDSPEDVRQLQAELAEQEARSTHLLAHVESKARKKF